MYDVTQDYIDKATAAGRVYSVRLTITKAPEEEPPIEPEPVEPEPTEPEPIEPIEPTEPAEPTEPDEGGGEEPDETPVETSEASGEDIMSMKIVRGQTTGSFTLGNTVCASLEVTVANHVQVTINDPIHVEMRFGEGENATEWRSLGHFYVDSIKQAQNNKTITAYDVMLQLSRIYKSELNYPASVSAILEEIGTQTGVGLSENVHLFNDVEIDKKPQGDSTQAYYTRRDILGYMAGINGGSAYIDVDGTINISAPAETDFTISSASVTEQTMQDTNYSVRGVVWNTLNQSLSVGDKYVINTIDVYNPLSFASQEQVLENLKTNLVGLAFDSVTIKKQGTGMFQLGDLVDYVASDEKTYRMLIMGIVYNFTNGFFFETLYSMAQSSSQQRNQGNKVNQDAFTVDFPEFETPVTPGDIGKFAYTTGIHFRGENGFDLDFKTIDGNDHTNKFEFETDSDGQIIKIKNVTAQKEINVSYGSE